MLMACCSGWRYWAPANSHPSLRRFGKMHFAEHSCNNISYESWHGDFSPLPKVLDDWK